MKKKIISPDCNNCVLLATLKSIVKQQKETIDRLHSTRKNDSGFVPGSIVYNINAN